VPSTYKSEFDESKYWDQQYKTDFFRQYVDDDFDPSSSSNSMPLAFLGQTYFWRPLNEDFKHLDDLAMTHIVNLSNWLVRKWNLYVTRATSAMWRFPVGGDMAEQALDELIEALYESDVRDSPLHRELQARIRAQEIRDSGLLELDPYWNQTREEEFTL